MKIKLGRRTLMMGTVTTIVVGLLALAVLGVAGIAGWEYTNSDAFCAAMCHSVHPEESISHKTSAHARVHCVECHMGRTSTLHLIALKPAHIKELWGMIVGYERPTYASGLRPAREACESCHWPQAEHHDSVAVNKRFGTDPKSSETDYRLTLHTTANIERELSWKVTGIHWHIGSDVEFKSPDPQGRSIPWVEIRKPDGSRVTYIDAESKLSAAELGKLEPRRMECYNCHNAVGHPFPNPVAVVDEAIASGKIDRGLPSVKARAVSLIEAVGDLSGKMEDRAAKVDKVIADYAAKTAVPPDLKDKDLQFQKAMKDILLTTSFEEKGITWKSFPNHAQHRDSPGCFRCHDGKHFNDKGEAIRLQCTLCHNLPQVKLESGGGSVASTIVAGVSPPDSHNAPNFMHEHRLLADPSCSMCHGELKFGREGGNFCANPACHGRAWPDVNLNAEPPKTAKAPEAPTAAPAQKAAPAPKAAGNT